MRGAGVDRRLSLRGAARRSAGNAPHRAAACCGVQEARACNVLVLWGLVACSRRATRIGECRECRHGGKTRSRPFRRSRRGGRHEACWIRARMVGLLEPIEPTAGTRAKRLWRSSGDVRSEVGVSPNAGVSVYAYTYRDLRHTPSMSTSARISRRYSVAPGNRQHTTSSKKVRHPTKRGGGRSRRTSGAPIARRTGIESSVVGRDSLYRSD